MLKLISKRNFTVVITKTEAASLKAGIADPASRFIDKTIRATAAVKGVQAPRIEIDDVKQIQLVLRLR